MSKHHKTAADIFRGLFSERRHLPPTGVHAWDEYGYVGVIHSHHEVFGVWILSPLIENGEGPDGSWWYPSEELVTEVEQKRLA